MIKNKQKLTVSHYFYLTPKRCGPFFLVQAGESFCSADTVIPSHMQRCFELTYALSGNALCYANDTATKIEDGDCFFSFPGEVHKIESDATNPLHFIFFAFYTKENSKENRYIKFIKESFRESETRKLQIPQISETLRNILNELKGSDEYTPRMVRSHLEELLIECCRKIHNKPTLVYPVRYSDSDMLTKDLILYIDENAEKIKSAAELAKIFHYSLPNLSKIFREGTGLSIGKYINSKRLELSNRLLDDGLSITEVGERLGFSSIHTFSRAYKNYFHISPSSKKTKRRINKQEKRG